MPRRYYIGGTGGGMPAADPYAAQRADLAERRFAQTTQDTSERLSMSQEARLLQKAQLVFEITKARQTIEDKRDATLHAAAIVEGMGGLNINDPNYETKRANILADHAPSLGVAQDYVKQKDSIWEAQQKTASAAAAANQKSFYDGVAKNYGLTSADLDGVAALPGGTVKYFDAGGNPVSAEAARGNESRFRAQIPVGNDIVTMRLPAFQSMMRLHGEYSGQAAASLPTQASAATQGLATAPAATAALGATRQPAAAVQPAQPAATPAAAIATDDATAFLRSIGVGVPAQPAAQPTAQPVQAAQSGLPDEADASLTPEPSATDDWND
jgi:hypothetical protein